MTKIAVDLADLDVVVACNKAVEIELVHPVTKVGLGQFIGVVGKESDEFRNFVASKANSERLLAAAKPRNARDKTPKTLEEDKQDGCLVLATCTKSFRCNDVEGDEGSRGGAFLRYRGQSLSFSFENAVKFYSDPGMVPFYDQINEGIANLENFMKS